MSLSSIVYFDYAATTPIDPDVLSEMNRVQVEVFGNPHSRHRFGQAALLQLDQSRDVLAAAFGVQSDEVVFTNGATESNNLALKGFFASVKPGGTHQLLISAIEHPSIREVAKRLGASGMGVENIRVDANGIVDLPDLEAKITPDTRFLSVMAANNEIGSIQPLAMIGRRLSEINREREQADLPRIFFHSDATQAAPFLDLNLSQLGVDLCSVSAHKMYGPKGIGALIVRGDRRCLARQQDGGPQEFRLRAGTVNVPAAAGFAKAMDQVIQKRNDDGKRLADIRNHLRSELVARVPTIRFFSPPGNLCLPNFLNFDVPDLDTSALFVRQDLAGFALSTGTACSSGDAQASPVLAHLPLRKRPPSSLRLTLGRPTTAEEAERWLAAFIRIVNDQREVEKS